MHRMRNEPKTNNGPKTAGKTSLSIRLFFYYGDGASPIAGSLKNAR